MCHCTILWLRPHTATCDFELWTWILNFRGFPGVTSVTGMSDWHDIIWVFLFWHLPDGCVMRDACDYYRVQLGISWTKFFSPIVKWKPFAATTICSPFPSSFWCHVWSGIPELSPGGSHMHHASHNYLANTEKKLILCHVTSDMLVTLVTPGKPRKFKIQVQSSKSRVAIWGLNVKDLLVPTVYWLNCANTCKYSWWSVRDPVL